MYASACPTFRPSSKTELARRPAPPASLLQFATTTCSGHTGHSMTAAMTNVNNNTEKPLPPQVSPKNKMGFSLGWAELEWRSLARSLMAELLGTMLLVIIGCGAAINWKTDFDVTQVSLAFGLAVAAIVSVVGPVSGGHLNPAVSVGLLAGGQLPLLNCLGYILCQCGGAIAGAALLHAVTPEARRATLGANALGDVEPWAGVLLEALLTMLLVLVVFSTAVDSANRTAPGLAPLLIGLTVTAAHLVLIPYTGTSINPARSLGPAVVGGRWAEHWVFWVGPLAGGAVGGVIYTGVFSNGYTLGRSTSDDGIGKV